MTPLLGSSIKIELKTNDHKKLRLKKWPMSGTRNWYSITFGNMNQSILDQL